MTVFDMFVHDWAWLIWVGLVLVFVIIELLSVDFVFLMFALGCVGGVAASLLGAPVWGQIIIAGVLALLLLFFVRPALKRRLRRGADPTPSNVAALLGLSGTIVRTFDAASGQVKLANGETWTTRLSSEDLGPLGEGERVVVTAIDGAIAVVAPAEGKAL